MTLVQRLVDQLRARGLWVEPGAAPGELKLRGPKEQATPDVVNAVVAFKQQLLDRLGDFDRPAPASPPVAAEPSADEPDPPPDPGPQPSAGPDDAAPAERCPLCFATAHPAAAARMCDPAGRPLEYGMLGPDGRLVRVRNPPCHYRT